MSKPFTNPFFEADMSKLFDMSKFDMSKMTGDFRMPQMNMESMMTAQRRNIESFSALQQAASQSFQALWQRQAEMVRQAMEETSQMMSSIMSCPTPEEKMIKQAEVSKVAMEKCLANVRDITETISKCNSQAMEAVSNRMNESLDELRGIISSSRAA